MVWSFILSRTLVPTMAKYLLRKHERTPIMHGSTAAPRSRNPLVRIQRGFEAGFERVRAGYRDLLAIALRIARFSWPASSLLWSASFPLAPYLGRDFFPVGRRRPDLDACARTGRHPRRGNRPSIRRNREGDPHRSFRPTNWKRWSTISACRSAASTIPTTTPAPSVRRTARSRSAEREPSADRGIRPHDARGTAGAIPGHDFLVPAGRHHQPDPQFRRAGADRSADSRAEIADEFRLCATSCCAVPPRSRPGRCAHPAIAQRACVSMSMSTAPARNMSASPSATSPTAWSSISPAVSQVAPTFWLNPDNGVNYSIVMQTPQYQVDSLSALRNLPITAAGRASQILGGIANIKRDRNAVVYSQYNIQPFVQIYGPPRAAISAPSPPNSEDHRRDRQGRAQGRAR